MEFQHLKTFVITSRENKDLVMEAEDAGVDGIVFRSGIGLSAEGSFSRQYRLLLEEVCGYLQP